MNLLNKDFVESVPNEFGTENMALFLYSFILFTRPLNIIEVGSGYSSLFIAQAIEDVKNNVTNALDFRGPNRRKFSKDRKKYMEGYNPNFTIVEEDLAFDDQAFRFETLHKYKSINKISGDIRDYLKIDGDEKYDMVYLDFGDGTEYLKYFNIFWKKLEEGGSIFFHNTLNNHAARRCLAELKLLQRYEKDMEVTSFWEPHKKEQNSFTIVKKNKDYPIYYDRA